MLRILDPLGLFGPIIQEGLPSLGLSPHFQSYNYSPPMCDGGRVFDCQIWKCELIYLLSRNPNPFVVLRQGMIHPSANGYDVV